MAEVISNSLRLDRQLLCERDQLFARNLAAFEVRDFIVLNGREYLCFGPANLLDGFLDVAVDHSCELGVRRVLTFDRAWFCQFGLALFQPRGSGLFAIERPRLAMYNLAAPLDCDLRVISGGTVLALAGND